MHATIQKPIDEIARLIRPGEKVFVVGCNNCAWKCHSGGEEETRRMAERLNQRGVAVIGHTGPDPRGCPWASWTTPAKYSSRTTRNRPPRRTVSWYWAAARGVHTVIDATDGKYGAPRMRHDFRG